MVMALYNKTLQKVLVDTSALLSMCETKSDIYDVEEELGKVEFCITKSVKTELEKLSIESTKKKKCLNFLNRIISNFEVIDDNEKYADKGFITLADDDFVFITNDSELAKSLKKKGKRVFRLNVKNRFVEI